MDYENFSNNYKLIAIDLSKQTELGDPDLKQQITFIGKLEGQDNGAQDNGATMFFHNWKIRRKNFWVFIKTCKNHVKMETQKIVKFVNSSKNEFLKFAKKKWSVIDIESNGHYSHESPIKLLTKSIEQSLLITDAYILTT